MASLFNNLKQSLKRSPNIHRAYLNLATFKRCIKYRLEADDDCQLKDKWDFSTPEEQARHRDAIDATTSIIGPSLGDVLEIGCNRGQFTTQIARSATSVVALDVSDESCRLAKTRCSDFSNVRVHRLNLLQEDLVGQFDVAFVMCVLCYFKGRARLQNTADKLLDSLRDGGLLVIQEMRMVPQVEDSFWVRWLDEGAFHICDFFERQTPFRLMQKSVHQEYVTAIYRKPLLIQNESKQNRDVSSRFKKIYREFKIFQGLSRSAPSQPLVKRFSDSGKIATSSGHSLIRPQGLRQLQNLTRIVDETRVTGDFVECGVYRGGSGLLLGEGIKTSSMQRRLWLFDSFRGLPAPTVHDGPSAPYLESTLKSDAAEVAKLLRDHSVPEDRTTIISGWFHDTLHKAKIERIALLHIDADWYSSVKQCLTDLYHLVSPGGFVVLDDYNDWPGCKIALDEFLQENNLKVKLEGGSEGPCYFRKDG